MTLTLPTGEGLHVDEDDNVRAATHGAGTEWLVTLVNGEVGSFKLSLPDGRVLFISMTGTALVANEGENGNTVD